MWEGVWKIFTTFFHIFRCIFTLKLSNSSSDTFCNIHKCIAGFKALKTSMLSLPTNQGHFQLTIHLTIILDINFPRVYFFNKRCYLWFLAATSASKEEAIIWTSSSESVSSALALASAASFASNSAVTSFNLTTHKFVLLIQQQLGNNSATVKSKGLTLNSFLS